MGRLRAPGSQCKVEQVSLAKLTLKPNGHTSLLFPYLHRQICLPGLGSSTQNSDTPYLVVNVFEMEVTELRRCMDWYIKVTATTRK